MSETRSIPLPRPTPISQPFWDACKEERLTVQRCKGCGSYTFIPQPCCGDCLSEDFDWVESSGHGTLYSFSTVYRPQQPVFETPYTVVIVELDEGYHMLSNLIGVAPEDVEIGMRLEVFFEAMSDEITLPYFRVRREG
ncbi:MAG: Zn-ribbon domain-containing OB-fold protein [Myxococcota bacterium]